MDILDVVLRRQVHNLALQGGVVKLGNTASVGADGKRGLVMGVSHVVRQVDVAVFVTVSFNGNAALFRADQPEGDGLGGVDGIVVRPERNGFFRPAGIVVLEPAQESRLFQPSDWLGVFG